MTTLVMMERPDRTVAVSQLKARLSEHLRIVRDGGRVIVTDRGVPIARLEPLPAEASQEARTQRLVEAGVLRAPKAPREGFWTWFREQPRTLEDPDGKLRQAVLDERESGW
ncbi:MAG: type II toxin-antitoxin system prevent-host-death family antitoxin [Proteobacteria bacterium]|nr:type II toxin-antitoxin system prevent-host-death family antitoxin [Pseudomonadota bacterium]